MSSSKAEKMNWHFDNSYAKLPENFFTRMSPVKVSQPAVVVINHDLAEGLGLNLRFLNNEELAQLFSGNLLPEDSEPIAQAYAGHQFGHFTFLGDGRAHLIGEHLTPKGLRFDVQLKGSGQTPYGRRGDGRAALGPMLREYMISEAMYRLGIPTTRSLAVVTSGEPVYRGKIVPGAILTRMASSHIRVGTFEYLSANNDLNGLKQLADYTIARHYPEVIHTDEPYLCFLKAVIERQIDLIVHWMRVGFIHGVMNTDNMALSGETIDYGPCAFMDTYNPATVFSSIDDKGRYSYANQPVIAQWNLARLAQALLPLLHSDRSKAVSLAEKTLDDFFSIYQRKWLKMMRAKLGLLGEEKEDTVLITHLLEWMHQNKADYTNTFIDLSKRNLLTEKRHDTLFQHWYEQWSNRHQFLPTGHALMQANNPLIIPRNHQVEKSLEAALNGDMKPFQDLLTALREPYTASLNIIPYQTPPEPNERIYKTFCGT